ncbi:(2Fe-2S)-binding protein [Streptomyces polyrhachis]|uniref:(2Fe-2S)-binding protein n=1 Tax=Streptomyces polyrhachis TaxID=1282885 RepID=A0ABW2GF05_9ACTN
MSPQNEGWQPLPPSGDFDPEATGFVQMPSGGWDAHFAQDEDAPQAPGAHPLAAPGHGFVPPPIAAASTDPAETTSFRVPDFSSPPDAVHTGETGTWTLTTGEAKHPADGEASRTQGQISAWTQVAGGDTAADAARPTSEGAAMRRGLSASAAGGPAPAGAQTGEYQLLPEGAPFGDGRAPGDWTVSGEGTSGHHWPSPVAPAEDESGEYAINPGEVAHAFAEDTAAPVAAEAAEPVREEDGGAADERPDGPGTADPAGLQDLPDLPDEHPRVSYVLRVNEADRPVTDAWIGESLLYVLRERLGLAGAKDGCAQGECGACSVKVDGRLVASCLVPAATAAGSEIRTSEGLARDGLPSDVQRALAASGAVQCGFCIPGLSMTVHDLLEGNHTPSDRETRQALCGNLCRCTGYQGVLTAVQEVIAQRRSPEQDAGSEAHIPQQAGPVRQESAPEFGAGPVAASAGPGDPPMPPPRRPGEQEGPSA